MDLGDDDSDVQSPPSTPPPPVVDPDRLSDFHSTPERDLTPPVSPINSESDDETDIEIDYLDNDDDFGIPLQPPASRPMVNYSRDVENELDYEIGWEWMERDPGPTIGPYTGFRQCLLDPTQKNPEYFFTSLFEDRMFVTMAEMTNLYAHKRMQGR